MELPDYITVEEVKRVCQELKIRDWTELEKPEVTSEEAKTILNHVNVEKMAISLGEFKTGLEVELEHGIMFKEANVTNNHPILTGKIVLAHLKESFYYYKLLDVAELEGDLLEAIMSEDSSRIKGLYNRLANARMILSQAEMDYLI